ncbi:winged helix-turn-helix transcriptional regulator [Streptomyces hoynatensis]|uniref:Transcriptional regulator n=1 Tax=Streptomyces hoynatensis TaxID=1141874 RepID=A0A3A9Z3F9_9ACTN|nr:helix-turn-helix domain-containing protein [Streptomyces hoynatensis]RKN42364.1 transcriptional regulator [Streptomyces hoynatensis]
MGAQAGGRLGPEMFDELCPSTLVPVRFADKWAWPVLRCLEDGPRRFSELRVPLRRATARVLTHSLRRLERDGLISRTAHAGPPARVEYALTPLGRSLLEPLAVLSAWTAEHWEELVEARESYAARERPRAAGAPRPGG